MLIEVKYMLIWRFLTNRVFNPVETKAMGEAFEIICNMLSLKRDADDPLTRKVAAAVISAAEAGICDPEGLMAAALDTLGIPSRSDGETMLN